MVDSSRIICETTITSAFSLNGFIARLASQGVPYQYSEKLGVVKFEADGKVLIISEKGTVIIRHAESIAEAQKTLARLLEETDLAKIPTQKA